MVIILTSFKKIINNAINSFKLKKNTVHALFDVYLYVCNSQLFVIHLVHLNQQNFCFNKTKAFNPDFSLILPNQVLFSIACFLAFIPSHKKKRKYEYLINTFICALFLSELLREMTFVFYFFYKKCKNVFSIYELIYLTCLIICYLCC